jgi:uncharacterized protein (DUF3820 family)
MAKYDNQKMQFGKYKGRLCSWVLDNDLDYAYWVMTQSNSQTQSRRAMQSLFDRKTNNLKLTRNTPTNEQR